jgi:hypothetical protein
MPQWSLKRILSRLQGASKDEQDAQSPEEARSAGVSSASSPASDDIAGDLSLDDDAPVSLLAMMDESRPEAWLGNFLTIIGAPSALQYNTLNAARRDDRLRAHLQEVWTTASQDNPALLLDRAQAETLKAKDWGAWWRGQESLGRYAYSTFALAMLGDHTHAADLVALYRQEDNARIRKDAHYVICFLLGKQWPAYSPTANDLAGLSKLETQP